MKNKNYRCLLLNADYSPLSIIDWKKALTWHMKYEHNPKFSIDIIDFYKNDHIQGTNKTYPIPCVARTNRFFNIHKSSVMFCRKNIFLRDDNICQYCGHRFEIKELTYDHVIPRSVCIKNGSPPTTWTNIVTSCITCNRKKGNRTPKEASMPLKKLPVRPDKTSRYLPISHYLRTIKDTIPDEWLVYLPESYLN